MGVTEQLARLAVETPSSFLSVQLIDVAKARILDTVGVMLAGVRTSASRIAIETVLADGGHAHATIVGGSERLPVAQAGFVNGISAHVLQFDDHTQGVGHVSACVVPGALAMAEHLDQSGRALIEAYVLGFDVTCRLAKGLQPFMLDGGWHSVGIVGGQGVAVACCRLMGLDQLTTRMAMGAVASSTSGVRKNVGTMGKAFHAGNGVRAGILAALLAKRGYTMDPDIVEGTDDDGEGHQRFGLADTYNGIGNYRLDRMVTGLGASFELARNTTMVRMHPGSTAPAAAIDGMIALAEEHDLQAGDVREIVLECTPKCLAMTPYPDANDAYMAKYCLPYMMAVALTDREAGIEQYAAARVGDPLLHELMTRVRVVVPDDLKRHEGPWGENGVNWGEARLAVALRDGRVLRRHCVEAKGWPARPPSWDDLCLKFEQCARHVMSRGQIGEAIGIISSLETLDHVTGLTSVLRSRA